MSDNFKPGDEVVIARYLGKGYIHEIPATILEIWEDADIAKVQTKPDKYGQTTVKMEYIFDLYLNPSDGA